MRLRWVISFLLCALAPTFASGAAKVTIADDGMLLVDGTRTFAIGLYENPDDDAVLDQVAAAGFNLVRASSDKDALDRLHARGLYAWVNTGGRINLGADGTNPDTDLRELVEAVGAHPALLVWEVPDEILWGCWLRAWRTDGTLVEKFQDFRERADACAAGLLAGYKALNRIDPNHPIWMNHAPCNSLEDLTLFGRAADIVGCDIYPVMNFPQTPWDLSDSMLGAVGVLTHRMQSSAPGKPVWMVLQGFGYEDLGDGPLLLTTRGSRRPTPNEAYFMTYDAIVRGARAVLYWGTYKLERDSVLWNALLKTAREVADLAPVLAAPDATITPRVEAGVFIITFDNAVYVLGKEVDGKPWWFVVNEYPFPLSYSLKGLEDIEGLAYGDARNGRQVQVKNGKLDSPIDAYGVHIWKPIE